MEVGLHLNQVEVLRIQGYLTYKNRLPLGPYRRPMSRVLGGSKGGGRFLMSEVPQYIPNGTTVALRVQGYLAHKKHPTP